MVEWRREEGKRERVVLCSCKEVISQEGRVWQRVLSCLVVAILETSELLKD